MPMASPCVTRRSPELAAAFEAVAAPACGAVAFFSHGVAGYLLRLPNRPVEPRRDRSCIVGLSQTAQQFDSKNLQSPH